MAVARMNYSSSGAWVCRMYLMSELRAVPGEKEKSGNGPLNMELAMSPQG